jgi:hypothetical protein
LKEEPTNLKPNQATATRKRPVSTSASRSIAGPHAAGTQPWAKRGTMWLPVAVAMPMPAKLPITSANTESFCAAKMPVAPGSRPTEAQDRPDELAADDVEQQDCGDEPEGGNGDPALTPVPILDQPTHSRRHIGTRATTPAHAAAAAGGSVSSFASTRC